MRCNRRLKKCLVQEKKKMDQNTLERKAALLAAQGWEPMRLARTPVGTCVITSDPFVVMDQIMIRVEKTDGKKQESFIKQETVI